MKFKELLRSKKFIVTLSGVIVVIANDGFNLGLDKETVISVVAMVTTYVLGQSHVDGKKAE